MSGILVNLWVRVVEGAIASAVNLDNGVQDSFQYSEEEICYLGVQLGLLLSRMMYSLQNCSLEVGYKESQPINLCHLCGCDLPGLGEK